MVAITGQVPPLRLSRCAEDGGEVPVVRGPVVEVGDYAEVVGDEGCEDCKAVGEEETLAFVGVDVDGCSAEDGGIYQRPVDRLASGSGGLRFGGRSPQCMGWKSNIGVYSALTREDCYSVKLIVALKDNSSISAFSVLFFANALSSTR